jgi:dTDP-4-amino-4,6-dideoxygalactose transaminase
MAIIKVAQPYVGKEEAKAVNRVILSGRYISGANVEKLENRFAAYVGTKYAVAVNSGTAALHIALKLTGVGAGDEVIVPPLTFFSTISAVAYQNAIPVFADIDAENYCIDPADVEKKISKRTKAILPVHLFGNSAEMGKLMRIAKKHKLRVIEDAAQAHGTEYKQKKAGSIGDVGIFSFFATKHMTTGEGGMLVTDNKRWADLAKAFRSHGMSDRDHHDFIGYNYRMNEIAGAMGLVQLRRLDRLNKKRIENSLYLIGELNKKNIPWIKVPKPEKHIKHTFFWCPVLIDEERLGISTRKLRDMLRAKGVEVRHRYWEPLYRQKALSHINRNYSNLRLKNAEKIAGKIIGLPNHAKLIKNDLDRIIEILENIT